MHSKATLDVPSGAPDLRNPAFHMTLYIIIELRGGQGSIVSMKFHSARLLQHNLTQPAMQQSQAHSASCPWRMLSSQGSSPQQFIHSSACTEKTSLLSNRMQQAQQMSTQMLLPDD